MQDSLRDVCDQGDGEEDGEDVGDGDVGAEFPDGVVVVVGDVAVRAGGIVDCHLEDRFLSCCVHDGNTEKEIQLTNGKGNLGGNGCKDTLRLCTINIT